MFDPRHLPNDEKKPSDYGTEKVKTLIDFYDSVQELRFDGNKGVSKPDIDSEDTESEWKLFCSLMFVQRKDSFLQQVLSTFLAVQIFQLHFPICQN